MKKLILICLMVQMNLIAQTVKISGPQFKYNHGDLVLYADKDTNSQVSVHCITHQEIMKLDEGRSDRWHGEKPRGPYKKQYYVNSGYDLGHLTPSHITSYDDSLNYHSFSMMNQAPQVAAFNRGKWARLEALVVDSIKKDTSCATIVTGVIYDNNNKTYLQGSRIKIPVSYFKVLVIDGRVSCWVGSNINGLITRTDLEVIIKMLGDNGDNLDIFIEK